MQEFAETSLHYAISRENNGNSLHIVDFLVQNSTNLNKQTREGNTPLHYCVIQNQCESMRLLLRSGANPCVENNNGKTPIDIAKERGHHLCEEMVGEEGKIQLLSLEGEEFPVISHLGQGRPHEIRNAYSVLQRFNLNSF